MSKTFLEQQANWPQAIEVWDKNAKLAAEQLPLKSFSHNPNISEIEKKDAFALRWKSLEYLLTYDSKKLALKNWLKHPGKYTLAFIKSCCRSSEVKRVARLHLYGFNSLEEFKTFPKNAIVLVGFSYCQKPLECPSKRFQLACQHDYTNPICQQCFIGKAFNFLPPEQRIIPKIITTAHDLEKTFFEIMEIYPKRPILFLITACPLALKILAYWYKVLNIKGIGSALEGRICNNLQAFKYAEGGKKLSLTLLSSEQQVQFMELIHSLHRSPE